MSKRVKKEKSVVNVSLRIVARSCVDRKSLKPIMWLLRHDFRYGTRKQLTGNLIDYVGYCRRTKQGVIVDNV